LKGSLSSLPGTRSQTLLLAQMYPAPKVDASNKKGMWSTSRCFYAYYSDEVLSAGKTGFKADKGSKKYRFRVGLEDVVDKGRLTKRQAFCACSSCHAPKFDFENCNFKTLVGTALAGYNPMTVALRGARPAVMEIAEFSETLKEGQVRAVDVAPDQVEIEGAPFWLCRLMGDGFQTSAPLSFGGEAFEQGYYLAKIQWYEFVDVLGGQRRYRLKPEERMLSVHSFIRCAPVSLIPADGPRGRGRPTSTPILILPKSECSGIMEYAAIDEFEFSEQHD